MSSSLPMFRIDLSISNLWSMVIVSGALLSLSNPGEALAQCAFGELSAPDEVTDARYFGVAVAISGDLALVGAPASCEKTCGDIVFAYHFDGSAWVQEGRLVPIGQGINFGISLAMVGDLAVIGTAIDDGENPGDPNCNSGAAYIFRRTGGEWIQETKLTASETVCGDSFGLAIAYDGTTLVVGANGRSDLAGAAYVFRRDGLDWIEEAKLQPQSLESEDRFGGYVSLLGEVIAVGVSRDDDQAENAGAAFIFRWDGAEWAEEAKVIGSLAGENDKVARVALGTGFLLLGGQLADVAHIDAGIVHVFRNTGTTWIEEAALQSPNARDSGEFGSSLLTQDDLIIIGAEDDDAAASNSGAVFLYRWSESGVALETTLVPSVPHSQRDFGAASAISGDFLLIGAPSLSFDDPPQSAELFLLSDGPGGPDCNTNEINDSCDIFEGRSTDCNGNQIPDECDVAAVDCNSNGRPDECDIAEYFSTDCNGNEIPDECDIASGTSGNCNENAAPDECESTADCNTNGVQDICEIFDGTSSDCNFDLVPDECQPDEDCNGNGTRDLCDIGAGTSDDCNANLAPDDCDITDGTSVDVDGDGIPDECCVLAAVPVQETILHQTTQVDMPNIMNRYIGLSAGDPGVKQAIRIVIESSDRYSHLEHLVGRVLWAGPKEAISELGSSRLPIPGFATYWVSEVQCEPFFDDWHGVCDVGLTGLCIGGLREGICVASGTADPATVCAGGPDDGSPCADDLDCPGEPCETDDDCGGGILNLYGAAIVPSMTYTVQAVSEFCNLGPETSFSDPVVMATSQWGDILQQCTQDPCVAAGDGVGINDVFGMVTRFTSSPGAPSQPRSDLEPLVADGKEDITDILHGINAFSGLPYWFLRCNGSTCPGVSPTKACISDADCQLEPCP